MADLKISQLTDGVTANATDQLPVERGAGNRRVTMLMVLTYILNNFPGRWLSGSGVPGGGLGNNGDFYYDSGGAQLLYFKTAGTWNVIELDPSIINGGALVAANIVETITNGVTTNAPSENAVFDALAPKEDTANKASDFSTLNGTKYPATNAFQDAGGVPIGNIRASNGTLEIFDAAGAVRVAAFNTSTDRVVVIGDTDGGGNSVKINVSDVGHIIELEAQGTNLTLDATDLKIDSIAGYTGDVVIPAVGTMSFVKGICTSFV